MANPEHVEILLQGSKIWNKWREKNHEVIPDLTQLNLAGADLSKANLFRADLSRTDLSSSYLLGADLSQANLTKAELAMAKVPLANFTGTNLTECTLMQTEFTFANLTNANFTKAILERTNLAEANLTETNFAEACAVDTLFINIDLSTAKGLESVYHIGPSTLGLDTIIKSKGKIPDVFLRGCGVPEDFITYLPSLINKPIEFYSCFISYSHADKAFARQLHDFLQGRGIRCWLDEHQLLPGHDIFEEVDRGIKLWDKVLLCASKDSLSSWWVDNEINRAFKKEQTIMKSRGKKVLALIPLDLDGFIFSDWENGKAEQVKSRLAADFQGWQNDNDKLQQQFELVLKALRTDGGREAPPVSRL